ncbi:MAG: glycosyltransferase family 39 protein [Clostridia bacterium]|nr:glycosyltransferase family 39 protein [Clostridia bacterium]
MRTIGVSLTLAVTLLTAVFTHFGPQKETRRIGAKAHRAICIAAFLLGCFARLIRLADLPGGISADEALVAAQAKSLWQTGGFLFSGGLTTHFAQWTGETCGPLLATITAPFVGIFGMNILAVRLPLVLLSIAAMPFAYGLGEAIGGRRAGRWLLIVYALCPYFVLSARLTGGVQAAVCLVPMALCLMARGMKKPWALALGGMMMAMTAYAQDLYMMIAPAAIVICAGIAAAHGMKKRHALLAALPGLALVIPALLTLYVNMTGAKGMTLFGMVEIPAIEGFIGTTSVLDTIATGADVGEALRSKLWAVISGGFFQILTHVNMSIAMYAPEGLVSLYLISLPLMLLGALTLLSRRGALGHARRTGAAVRTMAVCLFILHMLLLVLYGSRGVLETQGTTSVYDFSVLLIFSALLMTAGLCSIERRSFLGAAVMKAMLLGSFCLLLVHMLGGSYQGNASMYFEGFGELSARAAQAHWETGAKVYVTDNVYPHVQPAQAAEMMYLYGSDADMEAAAGARGMRYEVVHMPSVQTQADAIYLARADEIAQWALEGFSYEEAGNYALLIPSP